MKWLAQVSKICAFYSSSLRINYGRISYRTVKNNLGVEARTSQRLELFVKEERLRERERKWKKERETVWLRKLNFLLNDKLKRTEIFVVQSVYNWITNKSTLYGSNPWK